MVWNRQQKQDNNAGIHRAIYSPVSTNAYASYFLFLKNEAELKKDCIVSGMLLYAKTDEAVQPEMSYKMSGNRITVETLALVLLFAFNLLIASSIVTFWDSIATFSEAIANFFKRFYIIQILENY